MRFLIIAVLMVNWSGREATLWGRQVAIPSWATQPAGAAAPPSIDRIIRKQPAYKTKTPRYALLVFGAKDQDCVWLVQDGDTLYVDRNGNGDLTDPGEAVAAEKQKDYVPREGEFSFAIGELEAWRTDAQTLASVSYAVIGVANAVDHKPLRRESGAREESKGHRV